MLLSMKFQMQTSFIESLNCACSPTDISNELNWLRLRTVHCKGLLLTDVKGTCLKRKIYDYLKSINDPGKILAIVVFPDYSRLLKLEKQRLTIKDIEMIYTMKERKKTCFQRCFPQPFNSLEEYEMKFIRVESKMQEEIEGVIESSGQCFICFNNMKTAENCLRKFNSSSPFIFLLTIYTNLRNRCCVKRNLNLERGFFSELRMKRKISTFNKYSESVYQEEEEDEKNAKPFIPLMTLAPDPYDINWLNITSTSESFVVCRRLMTNLLIVAILLFLTTPLAFMQALMDEFSLSWINDIPHPFNQIVLQLLPSSFIVLVNQLILLVIDYSSELEYRSSFSGYQISNLNKALFYMLLNILVLPLITIGTSESLFVMLMQEFQLEWTEIVTRFYSNNNNLWYFFLMVLLEQGVLSFICYVLRIKELFFSLGDVTFAYFKRSFLNEKAVWRREVDDIFQYGYFSAQMIVCLAIAFVFGYQYPIMLIAGILYFLFRHIGDAYNILVVNQNEMNSHGKFIQLVLIYSFLPLCLVQIIEIAWLIINQNWIELGFISFFFLITFLIILRMPSNLYNTENFYENVVNNELKKVARKWQEFYQHPLVIPSFQSFQEENLLKNQEKIGDTNEEKSEKKEKRKKTKKLFFQKRAIVNLENFNEY